ncbi:hypothetical protein BS50DRAFT_566800 [Corynespora cassiicola Philippines]|uniref:Uncharacterized protein n=1 Tax=Corynespora cassiicola Philippines TaxID=1448308 RepID=A0A2T2P889_CORCC|nr:hypothetical protein BS50DRAFT_566800 [Corynespora cassiicola Philippines]
MAYPISKHPKPTLYHIYIHILSHNPSPTGCPSFARALHKALITLLRTPLSYNTNRLAAAFNRTTMAFAVPQDFLPDVFHLLALLPIAAGAPIEAKLLFDLVIAAAREMRMGWCEGKEERTAVMFGILHALRLEAEEKHQELGEMMRRLNIGCVEDWYKDGDGSRSTDVGDGSCNGGVDALTEMLEEFMNVS